MTSRSTKRRVFGLLVAAAILYGCWGNVLIEFDVPDLGIETIDDALYWVAHNITYISDDIHDRREYWQDPFQTYTWRTGDCEDFSILLMYLMHRDVGLDPSLVVGWVPDRDGELVGHGWVRVGGEDYEAIWGECRTAWFTEHAIVRKVISYEEVMRRSTTIHRSVVDDQEIDDG